MEKKGAAFQTWIWGCSVWISCLVGPLKWRATALSKVQGLVLLQGTCRVADCMPWHPWWNILRMGLYVLIAQNNSPPVTMDVSLRVTIKLFNLGCSILPNKTCFVRHFSVRRHVWTSYVSYKTCHCNTFLGLQKEFTNLCVQALDSYDSLAAWHETEHVCLSDKITTPLSMTALLYCCLEFRFSIASNYV